MTMTPMRNRTAWNTPKGFISFDPEDNVSPARAVELAGLDTPVTMHDIFDSTGKAIPRKKETRRNGQHLGIVGDGYALSQTSYWLEIVEILVMESQLKVTTVGQLRNGAQEFMLFEWPETLLIGGEPYTGFGYAENSHDGSISMGFGKTNLRMFCTNQLPAIRKGLMVKLRHTASMKQRLDQVRAIARLSVAADEQFSSDVEGLLSERFTQQQFGRVVETLAPLTDERNIRKEGRSLTMAVNAQTDLWTAWKSDNLNNIRGTQWGAYNALVEYYDWAYSSDHRRAERAVTRSTDALKKKALSVVKAFA